jgi:cytosine/adenosine deaminase-related metal-dependent hydrolase
MTARVRWHARWVVPIASPPVAHGTVVTEADRIVWVGPRASAPPGGRDEELDDMILAPGLVNTHTHLNLTVLRGFLEDLPFFDWVRTLTAACREVLTDDDFVDAATLGIAEGLANGVTTFADTEPGDAAFTAMLRMGVRGIAYREVFGPDPAHCDASLATLQDQVEAMTPRATDLVRVGVSPHAPYSVSDALYRAVASWAATRHLPVAVHIAEGEDEQQLVTRGEGRFAEFLRGREIAVVPRAPSPIALLREAGLLRADTLLIHGVRVSPEEVLGIARAGCGVAHCPASNARLGHGIAPLDAYLRAGARVGLGSDSVASNDRMDILEEARLASTLQRTLSRRHDGVNARAALRLATLGGAEALRLDDAVGSLEIGKQADLVAWRLPAHGAPHADPVSSLVFGARGRAERVVVAGRELVTHGTVRGVDGVVARRVEEAAGRLAKWRTARSVS